MREKEIQKLDRSLSDKLMRRVAGLEQQNAELMAHLHHIKGRRSAYFQIARNAWEADAYMHDMSVAIDQTPKQSLANIQADAIEKAITSITWSEKEHDMDGKFYVCVTDMHDYANQLREQNNE